MQASLTCMLAKHLARDIVPDERTRARLHLMDWLGCVAGALLSETMPIARLQSGNAARKAAWLGNKLEMDDVHRMAILHPGPVVWATCLAQGITDMDRLLDAAIRGYEAMIAIGSTFDARHYAFWHNTATAGLFGAAVSALCCRGDAGTGDSFENQLVHAMGLAGSVTGGFWQMRHEPCDAKQWHIAHAVNTGTLAADAVLAGARGPAFILEGPQGLHAATTDAARPIELADHWRIRDVSFKPWAACRHAHPAIDAALELKRRLGHLDGPIEIETYRDALAFCDRPDPASEIEAKFSIQHSVALVADKGTPALGDFDEAARTGTAATRARITVREVAEFSERYPRHFGARARCAGQEVTLIDTLGDPERPMTEDAILAKAQSLFALGGREDDFAEMARAVMHGSSAGPVMSILERWLA